MRIAVIIACFIFLQSEAGIYYNDGFRYSNSQLIDFSKPDGANNKLYPNPTKELAYLSTSLNLPVLRLLFLLSTALGRRSTGRK
jgi:hypothetical protein